MTAHSANLWQIFDLLRNFCPGNFGTTLSKLNILLEKMDEGADDKLAVCNCQALHIYYLFGKGLIERMAWYGYKDSVVAENMWSTITMYTEWFIKAWGISPR